MYIYIFIYILGFASCYNINENMLKFETQLCIMPQLTSKDSKKICCVHLALYLSISSSIFCSYNPEYFWDFFDNI